MKNKHRFLSFALTVSMLLAVFPLGVSAACSHSSTSTAYQCENDNEHSYYAVCDYCGESLYGWAYSGWSSHSFSGNTCSDCGFTKACDHGSTSTVYSYENDSEHSYYAVCDDCGESLSGWAYYGWSSHSFSGNTCSDCGYTKSCDHSRTYYSYSSDDESTHYYYETCRSCGSTVDYGSESHSFSGSSCSDCGYTKSCDHSSTYYEYSEENENEHSYYSVCWSCGDSLYGWQYSGWESHNFDNLGTCNYCGYSRGCSHGNTTTVYQYENENQHSYCAQCDFCDEKLYDWQYSGWADHSFVGLTCQYCGYTKQCDHGSYTTQYTKLNESQHRSCNVCNDCGYSFNSVIAAHSWNYSAWTADNEKAHSCIKSCACGASMTGTGLHTFSANKCTTCGYTSAPVVKASVTMSASGPSGTLDSGGGELVSETFPASYSVSATAVGCNVTRIEYEFNGQQITEYGSSASVTANTKDEFVSTTFTAYTDVPGVTATITVNFKFIVKGSAYIMWETSDEATIRSISGNGISMSLDYTMYLPTSYDSQGNLTADQIADIQGLIGRNDGKTYTLDYTRMIYVYIPAQYSSTGEKQYLGTYDGNSDSDIESCVAEWGWTSGTVSAIQQAARSSLSFTTGTQVICTAYWIDSSTGNQLCTKDFGGGIVTASQAIQVSVSYGEFGNSDKYIYESLDYSGDTDGTSTSQSYLQLYTVNSQPLTVTFYCHPKLTTGSITVYVCDARTGMSISGASVDSSLGSRSTDSSGSTTYSKVALGSYSFTASKAGYESGSGSVDLTSATSESVTIYLVQKAVTPTQPTKGSITVYVQNSKTGAAISGASVSGSYSGSTDSSGSVDFSDVPFGTYSFSASKSGFSSDSGSVTISAADPSGSLTLSLTPDEPDIPDVTPPEPDEPEEPEEPDEPEEIFGRITVIVRDDYTNEVISGASVSGSGYSGTTDSSGNVRFTNLTLGYYSFTASKSGYISDTGSARIDEYSTTASVTIYLTPESTDTEIPKPEIPKSGSITVTVKDAKTDAVISGATVSSGSYSRATNSSGKAAFNSMPFGSYNFTAAKAGYISNSKSTVIDADTTTSSITIYLTPEPTSGDITVTVRDRDTNELLADASVVGGSYSGMTDSSGKVKFTEVDFGSHTFTASKYGYESNTASVSISVTSVSASVTIYLPKIKADVGIIAREINGTVYRCSTIMVSADVYGDDLLAFTPDEPLIVKMTATRNGGTVFSTQSESVICPSGENNLVWFEVVMPENGYTSSNVTFEFEVSTPDYVTDARPSDNKSSKTVTVVVLPDRDAPDADASLDAPSGFNYSVYNNDNSRQLTWSVWEWDDGFVKLNYSAKLAVTAKLTPDSTAAWSEYNNTERLRYTRSGYGINTEVKVRLSGVPTEMFAGNAKVNAYYPEFNYSTEAALSDMLLMIDEIPSGYGADFTFKPNNDSISRGKMHMTPIWFPDGEYSVRYEIYDVWTPAGMLSADSYALIVIEGSMYDDYYTQRG